MIIPAVIREKARDFEEKDLQDYLERVLTLLDGLKPGEELEVQKITREANRELFVECIKYFISLDPMNSGIQFNSDFSRIIKYEVF
jgi:hypothetical protein